MITEKISYKKVRDFGQVFGASFNFTKQNFKPIAGALLLTIVPLSVVIAYLSIRLQAQTNSFSRAGFGLDVYKNLGLLLLNNLSVYLLIIILSWLMGAIINTIFFRALQKNEELPKGEKITSALLLKSFIGDVLNQLINIILISITFIISLSIIGLVFGLLLSLGVGAINVIVGILLFFFILFFLFILLPIIFHVIVVSLFVCYVNKTYFIPATKEVLRVMKGNFWNTWLVIFVGGIYYMVASTIVSLPTIILSLMKSFSKARASADDSTSIALIVATTISSLLQRFILGTLYLMIIYQHMSCKEKKEGSTISGKIDSI